MTPIPGMLFTVIAPVPRGHAKRSGAVPPVPTSALKLCRYRMRELEAATGEHGWLK